MLQIVDRDRRRLRMSCSEVHWWHASGSCTSSARIFRSPLLCSVSGVLFRIHLIDALLLALHLQRVLCIHFLRLFVLVEQLLHREGLLSCAALLKAFPGHFQRRVHTTGYTRLSATDTRTGLTRHSADKSEGESETQTMQRAVGDLTFGTGRSLKSVYRKRASSALFARMRGCGCGGVTAEGSGGSPLPPGWAEGGIVEG